MPVPAGPRLREEMGPVFQLYCPTCKNIANLPAISAKKTRSCQKCGQENVILCFNGINHPPGYVKRTIRRRTIAIASLFIMLLGVGIPMVLVWNNMGIFPFKHNPSPEELQVRGNAMMTLLLSMLVVGVAWGFIMQYCAWKPEEVELDRFLQELIQRYLPSDLNDLPVVKDKNYPRYIGFLRNPIGMRYVEMAKIITSGTRVPPKSHPQGACPNCGSMIPEGSTRCPACGLFFKKLEVD